MNESRAQPHTARESRIRVRVRLRERVHKIITLPPCVAPRQQNISNIERRASRSLARQNRKTTRCTLCSTPHIPQSPRSCLRSIIVVACVRACVCFRSLRSAQLKIIQSTHRIDTTQQQQQQQRQQQPASSAFQTNISCVIRRRRSSLNQRRTAAAGNVCVCLLLCRVCASRPLCRLLHTRRVITSITDHPNTATRRRNDGAPVRCRTPRPRARRALLHADQRRRRSAARAVQPAIGGQHAVLQVRIIFVWFSGERREYHHTVQ